MNFYLSESRVFLWLNFPYDISIKKSPSFLKKIFFLKKKKKYISNVGNEKENFNFNKSAVYGSLLYFKPLCECIAIFISEFIQMWTKVNIIHNLSGEIFYVMIVLHRASCSIFNSSLKLTHQ